MIMMRAAAEAVMNGRRKAGAEGNPPVCNALRIRMTVKTGETAPAWRRHCQTGWSKWNCHPGGVDEVEDLIGGEAAGIRGGVAVRWRSRPVRRGGGVRETPGEWGETHKAASRGNTRQAPRRLVANRALTSDVNGCAQLPWTLSPKRSRSPWSRGSGAVMCGRRERGG